MNKDLFFFSNYCEHCKDIINMITKKNLRELFIFVSVDASKYKIPEFVTHVPTIVTKQKNIITDIAIMEYLNNMIRNDTISPFSLNHGGYSSSYTLLSENGYDSESTIKESGNKNSFTMLESMDHYRIYTPENENTSKGNKIDDSIYEKYINSRNADDEFLKRNR